MNIDLSKEELKLLINLASKNKGSIIYNLGLEVGRYELLRAAYEIYQIDDVVSKLNRYLKEIE